MKSPEKRLAKKALSGVDTVKSLLCETFEESFRTKHKIKDKERSGELASATANEIFGDHTENTRQVFNENKELIINVIKKLGTAHIELKRLITDSLRIYMTAKFRLNGRFPNNYEETFKNAVERGIFIKGGDAPDTVSFLISIEDVLRRKKITEKK